jgi:2-succinyl-5-enolpyruvyl-6-hydroxy-3-cyclohexene-1-carboxylate synthase
MSEADVALAATAAFVDGLVAGGVRAACVSPGSRSTPLALALARHPSMGVHVHLDERSAAFFALGLAKATGAPVAIACTSGTAAANLLPAVVEASMARVPLVVLTADRPPELRGVGANQTIDQVELFGRYVVRFEDAPVPGDEPAIGAWRRRGIDAARDALASPPRPVHLNLPFREPLVPGAPAAPDRDVADVDDAVASGSGADEDDVAAFVDGLARVERGLVYAGGLRTGGEDVVALAERLGWPLVAEPHSGARRRGALAAGRLLLGSERFVDAHLPDAVLQVGAAPISRAGLALVGLVRRLLILDPDAVVADPHRRASARLVAPAAAVATALGGAPSRVDPAWHEAWRSASERVRSRVDALLDGWAEPFEGRIARDVADSVPDGGVLCIGSSLPIRDLDLHMRPRRGIGIVANRGASGIDGFVSTALGVAASEAPTTALMGDLTLLHDVGGLVWNARRPYDVVLVVANNGGGRIFSTLEQRALPELESLFTTPYGGDIGAIVVAAGARYARVERANDLTRAIEGSRRAGGVGIVDVHVDPERDRLRRDEIGRAVEQAIA